MNIYNTYFEDDEKNIHFLYTGKNAVLGAEFPEYYYANSSFTWARVAFCKISDTSLTSVMSEELDINLISSDSSTLKSFKLSVFAVFTNGRIDRTKTSCTLTSNNITSDTSYNVILTEDSYKVGALTKYGLGIWVGIDGYKSILTRVKNSLATSNAPINVKTFDSGYDIEYLDSTTASSGNNLVANYDLISSRLIANAESKDLNFEDRISVLETKTLHVPWTYIQNTISYSVTYAPSANNTSEIVAPTTMTSSTNDTICRINSSDKCVNVTQPGTYMIQLRQGFGLTSGSSNLDLAVYKNTTKVNELTLLDAITTTKHYSTSIAYICHLALTDSLYVKGSWSNVSSLKIGTNDTTLTINALAYD